MERGIAAQRTMYRALVEAGHVADRATLLSVGSPRTLHKLIQSGAVVRRAHGRYATPHADAARAAAHEVTAVAVGRTAAMVHQWPLLHEPRRPELAVPRGRNVSAAAQQAYDVSWRRFRPGEVVDGWVTGPERTVIDCALTLPFGQALAVADSALGCAAVSRASLLDAADRVPVNRWRRVNRVIHAADSRSAGPFESALRAICLEVPGLTVEPQIRIPAEPEPFVARVDLLDRKLKIVIEAESFAWHSSEPQMLERDCVRYCELGVRGFLVLRFTYAHVTRRPEWVAGILRAAVAERTR